MSDYRDEISHAEVAIADGTWAGRPCRVATVANLGFETYLGYGTTLAFSSWSYVHHIRSSKEVIYIDAVRKVPLHETLESEREKQSFEIDFGDYVEVEPGEWAPRSIRIEAKDYFTCEYRFQLVSKTHWMLKEVVSWFKAEDKSRGVIENVRVDDGRESLQDSQRQVDATRALFGGAGESDRRLEVASVPFVLGGTMKSGPYEIQVTLADARTVDVSATTNDPAAPADVPVGFLGEKGGLILAAPITLAGLAVPRRGSVTFRATEAWKSVRSVAVPLPAGSTARLPVNVIPVRWGETMAVNIRDSKPVGPSSRRDSTSRTGLTRAWQIRLDRTDDGRAKLTLDLVSIDGMHEFCLDLAAALLSDAGEVLSCGQLATTLKVVSDPVEQRFELNLGKLPPGAEPKLLAIGISPGDVISAPMGSRWGMLAHGRLPFEIPTLLNSPDANCRKLGVEELGGTAFERGIHFEFLGDRRDRRLPGNGPNPRRAGLEPHAQGLLRVLESPGTPDMKAKAIRLLAYSEAAGAAAALEPFATDPEPRVQRAAQIGLTFLGRPDWLEPLRSMLKHPPSWNGIDPKPAEVVARIAYERAEVDTLIALAHNHSDAAVDALGEILSSDIATLGVMANVQKGSRLHGRFTRATAFANFWGRRETPARRAGSRRRWTGFGSVLLSRRSSTLLHSSSRCSRSSRKPGSESVTS